MMTDFKQGTDLCVEVLLEKRNMIALMSWQQGPLLSLALFASWCVWICLGHFCLNSVWSERRGFLMVYEKLYEKMSGLHIFCAPWRATDQKLFLATDASWFTVVYFLFKELQSSTHLKMY